VQAERDELLVRLEALQRQLEASEEATGVAESRLQSLQARLEAAEVKASSLEEAAEVSRAHILGSAGRTLLGRLQEVRAAEVRSYSYLFLG
jgi:predicted  nucleic acid-binding Zn-ribbon protein